MSASQPLVCDSKTRKHTLRALLSASQTVCSRYKLTNSRCRAYHPATQDICSLTPQEKQMSASQPLVCDSKIRKLAPTVLYCLLRRLFARYRGENQMPPLASLGFLLAYIIPYSHFSV